MNKLLSKTFLWMFVGLLITFLTGYLISLSDTMVMSVYRYALLFVILELVIVIFFSIRVRKMSPAMASVCFILYSFITGLTFCSVFIAFNITSVMFIFLVAAVLFLIFGLIGYLTSINLSKLSTILFMGLLAIIIVMIVNIFLGNSTLDLIVSIIALIVFFGYTAYDIQHIKYLSNMGVDSDVVAINGALQLYLDFINIFLQLLTLFGSSNNNN